MNFIGKIRGADVEIRPLDALRLHACEQGLAALAEDIEPDQTEFYRAGIQCKVCIVSAKNIPMVDGARTERWDEATIFSVDPDFVYDVIQVARKLGMGYLPKDLHGVDNDG